MNRSLQKGGVSTLVTPLTACWAVCATKVAKSHDSIGELQAWDLNTGKLAWSHKYDRAIWALSA
jgi:hypothetical protein